MNYVSDVTSVFNTAGLSMFDAFIFALPIILGVAGGIFLVYWLWGKFKMQIMYKDNGKYLTSRRTGKPVF